jgi:hypothetical protein
MMIAARATGLAFVAVALASTVLMGACISEEETARRAEVSNYLGKSLSIVAVASAITADLKTVDSGDLEQIRQVRAELFALDPPVGLGDYHLEAMAVVGQAETAVSKYLDSGVGESGIPDSVGSDLYTWQAAMQAKESMNASLDALAEDQWAFWAENDWLPDSPGALITE